MYSSYRYRRDSKRLNHKGRILQRKTDYVIPAVDVIDSNLMKKYSKTLSQQGYTVYPPGTSPPEPTPTPEGYIEHTNSTTFEFTTSSNAYVVNNLGVYASLMSNMCTADGKRYCYKPFGFRYVNGGSPGSQLGYFVFQTGETSNSVLYVTGQNATPNAQSDVVCAWLIYDNELSRFYIWFAGTEDVSTADFSINIDDSDTNVGYYPICPISENSHPIFQLPNLSAIYMAFVNQTGRTIQYLEQPSHEHKIYTSNLFDDPSLID